tara:strand:+ start:318 stop:611 length:294 start_codon:yes stop_codon:yes gene_type:complete
MVDVEDRFAPMDNVSDYRLRLDRVESLEKLGACRFVFKTGFVLKDGVFNTTGDLVFDVPYGDDGIEGIYARAHDHLIDALRQMLYDAAELQTAYLQK